MLPEGFVYLKDVNSNIIQNLRYNTKENFLGERIIGYKCNKVILTKQAAEALSNVQHELEKDDYCLVIYDGYRPQMAVDSFIKWSENVNDQREKAKYYPSINKKDVFDLGYVAKKSGHTRGSTVDLTILDSKKSSLKEIQIGERELTNGEKILFLDDGTVDMGSSFDLLNEASHHDTSLVKSEFSKMRNYLRKIMKNNGFDEYQKEWWHYTLQNEPFPDTYFNFEIE